MTESSQGRRAWTTTDRKNDGRRCESFLSAALLTVVHPIGKSDRSTIKACRSARVLRSESLEIQPRGQRHAREDGSPVVMTCGPPPSSKTVNVKHAFWEEGAKALKARSDSRQTGLKRLGCQENVDSNLVDSASSHTLVSKIKPCMSKYEHLYCETAYGSLNQL